MSFKAFDLASDVASMVSSVNEVVSISSSLFASESYIKKYANIASSSVVLGGYWQTVFDSSPAATTSTPLLDFTVGYHSSSGYNVAATTSASQNEKLKVYRELASSLMGDADTPFNIAGTYATECFFVMVKRGLQKDELKKGSVSVRISSTNSPGYYDATDTNADTSFQQTIGGDYGYLLSGTTKVGQVWYNAGVIVLSVTGAFPTNSIPWYSASVSLSSSLSGARIDECVDGLRSKLTSVSFHNQTNLYSSIYFCRATNSEFNYSSNPTFVDDNKRIRVTSGSNILQTRTYITTIGLYDANDNLLAVAKVNKPITKSPDNEATFKVRLDY
jgi:hypothetical protein